jgi:putative ABC transport system permease protein
VVTVTLLARTGGEWRLSAAALRMAAREADPRLIADRVLPLEERVLTMLARPRLYAVVLGMFAACTLVIAGVGLVGVLSYSVSLRARELAIRAALGAGQADLLRLVLRQGLVVTAAGICVGLVASLWLMRALSSQLYGITSHDPVTFLLVPLFLLAAGVAACLAPALRAATLDAQTVLRSA